MNEDSGIIKWVLNTTSNNSIESRSNDISVPDLNDPVMIGEGFEHYNEMCVSCHGAPGHEQTELSEGLNPPAPNLVKAANFIDAKEMFWITKNGIKMTGMPAWGKTHSDEKIWAIVAFMKKLPEMKTEEYEKLVDKYRNQENQIEIQEKIENHDKSNPTHEHHH